MKSDQCWAAAGRTLAAVIVMLVLISLLAPGAAAQTYKVLYTFTGGPDGYDPYSSLTFDAAGNLYGTTLGGGAGSCQFNPPGCGTVFKLAPNPDGSWTKTVLHNFTGYPGDGAYPLGRLIFDTAGNLYGTTAYGGTSCKGQTVGCGTVFKLTPNPDGSWTETLLYSFAGGKDGTLPVTGLTFDTAGNLYSTTFIGGRNACQNPWGVGCGIVFKLTHNPDGSWTKSALHKFAGGTDGAHPWHAAVIFDKAGNLYGTAADGGKYGAGIVYQLKPQPDGRWKKRAIHRFHGARDGGTPIGSLISDGAGNLYGTTNAAGAYGYGSVYKLTAGPDNEWTYQVIHQFKGGKDGALPYATDVALDAAGNLYGVTPVGGAYGRGIVYKLAPNPDGSWKRVLLHTFTGGDDGESPYGGLTLGTNANLYGTASGNFWNCGSRSPECGVVFEITP